MYGCLESLLHVVNFIIRNEAPGMLPVAWQDAKHQQLAVALNNEIQSICDHTMLCTLAVQVVCRKYHPESRII